MKFIYAAQFLLALLPSILLVIMTMGPFWFPTLYYSNHRYNLLKLFLVFFDIAFIIYAWLFSQVIIYKERNQISKNQYAMSFALFLSPIVFLVLTGLILTPIKNRIQTERRAAFEEQRNIERSRRAEGFYDSQCPQYFISTPNEGCKDTRSPNPVNAISEQTVPVTDHSHNPDLNQPNPMASNEPRVMFWSGKVNQHWNTETHRFETDPLGFNDTADPLIYCKRFYPETVKTQPFVKETSYTWAEQGNRNNWEGEALSYLCLK